MTENEKRIPLTHGTGIVDKNASQDLINSLNNLVKCAYEQISKSFRLSDVSNSGCPKCGCNKITGDGSKAWCLNEKCDFVTTDC